MENRVLCVLKQEGVDFKVVYPTSWEKNNLNRFAGLKGRFAGDLFAWGSEVEFFADPRTQEGLAASIHTAIGEYLSLAASRFGLPSAKMSDLSRHISQAQNKAVADVLSKYPKTLVHAGGLSLFRSTFQEPLEGDNFTRVCDFVWNRFAHFLEKSDYCELMKLVREALISVGRSLPKMEASAELVYKEAVGWDQVLEVNDDDIRDVLLRAYTVNKNGQTKRFLPISAIHAPLTDMVTVQMCITFNGSYWMCFPDLVHAGSKHLGNSEEIWLDARCYGDDGRSWDGLVLPEYMRSCTHKSVRTNKK